MKRFLTIGISILFIGFVCIMYKTISLATDTKQYTLVHITASVPDEMDSDVTITFKKATDNIVLPITLLKGADYSENIRLLSGTTYMADVSINTNGNWIVEAESSYDIPNEAEFNINITIKNPDEGNVDDVLSDEKKENVKDALSDDSNETEVTSFESSSEDNKEFQELIAAISVIVNVKEYQSAIDHAKRDYNDYLEVNKANTKERWDSMTDFEKYLYTTTYLTPYEYLRLNSSEVGSNQYTLNTFLYDVEEGCLICTAQRQNYPYCDRVKEAFDKYYEYVYNRFVETRNIYDFHNDGSGHIDIESSSEGNELEELHEEILSEISKDEQASEDENSQESTEVEQKDQKPNKYSRLIDALKKSSLSIILLIIVGGAYLIVKNYNKRKNIYDNDK